MKIFITICVAAVLSGYSQEQCDNAIDQVTSATKEGNGVANTTAVIVAEARQIFISSSHRGEQFQSIQEKQTLNSLG